MFHKLKKLLQKYDNKDLVCFVLYLMKTFPNDSKLNELIDKYFKKEVSLQEVCSYAAKIEEQDQFRFNYQFMLENLQQDKNLPAESAYFALLVANGEKEKMEDYYNIAEGKTWL